eukprot:364397-Chlamydomonas_euryale.AAC.16
MPRKARPPRRVPPTFANVEGLRPSKHARMLGERLRECKAQGCGNIKVWIFKRDSNTAYSA